MRACELCRSDLGSSLDSSNVTRPGVRRRANEPAPPPPARDEACAAVGVLTADNAAGIAGGGGGGGCGGCNSGRTVSTSVLVSVATNDVSGSGSAVGAERKVGGARRAGVVAAAGVAAGWSEEDCSSAGERVGAKKQMNLVER